VANTPRYQISSKFRMPGDLEELGHKLEQLPEEQRQVLQPIFERVVESFRLRNRIMNVAKEALERIRLEVSCMQFDLEVTRRERESLKKQIEDG
jgi:hypothetical protein